MKCSLPCPPSIYILQGFALKVSLFFAYFAFSLVPLMMTRFLMSLAMFSQDSGFVGFVFSCFTLPRQPLLSVITVL